MTYFTQVNSLTSGIMLKAPVKRREPCAVKVASTVRRGGKGTPVMESPALPYNNLFFGFIKVGILSVIMSLIVAGIMLEGTGFVLGIACAGLVSMVYLVAMLEQKS